MKILHVSISVTIYMYIYVCKCSHTHTSCSHSSCAVKIFNDSRPELLNHRRLPELSVQISHNFTLSLHHTKPLPNLWQALRFKLVIYLLIASTAPTGRRFQSHTVTCWLKSPLISRQNFFICQFVLIILLFGFFLAPSFWLTQLFPLLPLHTPLIYL